VAAVLDGHFGRAAVDLDGQDVPGRYDLVHDRVAGRGAATAAAGHDVVDEDARRAVGVVAARHADGLPADVDIVDAHAGDAEKMVAGGEGVAALDVLGCAEHAEAAGLALVEARALEKGVGRAAAGDDLDGRQLRGLDGEPQDEID